MTTQLSYQPAVLMMSPSTPPAKNLSPAAPDYHADSETGTAFFDGVFIKSDSIKYSKTDRVLPVLEEEQIFMCRQMSGRLKPGLFVLDVGTGSGVLGIWAARHGCKVVAVDINPRALDMARDNAKYNNIHICESIETLTEGGIFFLEERFEEGFDLGNFDIILLNPPYNPTYPEIKPATHAEAGEDGQKAFNEQIRCVPKMLKQGGYCIVHHMSTITTEEKIAAFTEVNNAFDKGCEISYARILREDISSGFFLTKQYQKYLNKCSESVSKYIKEIVNHSSHFSLLYFEIFSSENGKYTLSLIPKYYHQVNAVWNDRISLHRKIVEHIEFPILHEYIRDLFIPDIPPFDVEENTDRKDNLTESDVNWLNSKLKIIDEIVKKEEILNNLDLLIVDTAPFYKSSDGSIQSLSYESKLWLGERITNDSDLSNEDKIQKHQEIFEEWLLNVKANHESTVATITHPSFTGLLSSSKWCPVYSSWSWQQNEQEKEIQQKYRDLLNDKREKLGFLDEKRIFLKPNTFLSSTLRQVQVPPIHDYYENVKGLEYCFEENINFNSIFNKYNQANEESRLKILSLCEKDLQHRIKALHTITDEKFYNKTSKYYTRDCKPFSIMISLPIYFCQQQEDRLKLSFNVQRDELPKSYRGGIWIYASAETQDKLNDCRNSLEKIYELVWLLYMDEYTLEAVQGQESYRDRLTRATFGHEFMRLITFIEKGTYYLSDLNNADIGSRFAVEQFLISSLQYANLCATPRFSQSRDIMLDDLIWESKKIAFTQCFSEFSVQILSRNYEKIEYFLDKNIIVHVNTAEIENVSLNLEKIILAGLTNALVHSIHNEFKDINAWLNENSWKNINLLIEIKDNSSDVLILFYNHGEYVENRDDKRAGLGTKAVMEFHIEDSGKVDIKTITPEEIDSSLVEKYDLIFPLVKTSIHYYRR